MTFCGAGSADVVCCMEDDFSNVVGLSWMNWFICMICVLIEGLNAETGMLIQLSIALTSIALFIFMSAMRVSTIIFKVWQEADIENCRTIKFVNTSIGEQRIDFLSLMLAAFTVGHLAFMVLPLYSLVVQMGDHYNANMIPKRVTLALKNYGTDLALQVDLEMIKSVAIDWIGAPG
eukprot:gene7024-8378_t